MLLYLPLMYFLALVELRVLNEVCPLSVNILAYLMCTFIVIVFSIILTFLILYILRRINVFRSETANNIVYSLFICSVTVVHLQLNLILPDYVFTAFSWINFRVLLLMLAPNSILIALNNVLLKRRDYLNFADFILIGLQDILISIILKYYWLAVFALPINTAILVDLMLFAFGYFITQTQFKYGSRFFLPNRCRTRRYEHRRTIAEEFELAKLDESMWPEWYIWLQSLHHPSLLAEDKSLRQLEGRQWYGICMKTQDGKFLHYFCLEWMFANSERLGLYMDKIDEFDD